MRFQILILDDEQMVCNSLKRILQTEERQIHISTDVEQAKKLLTDNDIDLLLLDYKLGPVDGLSFLKDVKEDHPEMLVIMITAHGNIDVAVEAMKIGAYDFIQKREEPDFIRFNIQRALDTLRLKKEVLELQGKVASNRHIPKIVSQSKQMKDILSLADEFAKSDSTILLTGETGTGKSLMAEYIHNRSSRFDNAFITINCSAIPSELIESELFGYEKGAFTGAHQGGKKGLIEQADQGTLFLDEVSELNPDMQTKLLHVLEKNEFIRVGAVQATQVNVRFIAATNAELEENVRRKLFRMDLFYRLNVATIHIPVLRNRQADVIPLAKIFISQFNNKFNKHVSEISTDAESFLNTHNWLGNVRELRNYIERAMLLKKTKRLELRDFVTDITQESVIDIKNADRIQLHIENEPNTNLLHEAQKQVILYGLKQTSNNITKTAKLLGIPRTTLNSSLQRFQLIIGKEEDRI